MKNKKSFIIISTVLVGILLVLGIILIFKKEDKVLLDETKIANLKEIKFQIPKFTIEIGGMYNGTLTEEDLTKNNIPIYEFDAGIGSSFATWTNHYVGVKVKDALSTLNINDYTHIYFGNGISKYCPYTKEEIDDDLYFVFSRDGNKIGNATISLLPIKYDYNYAIEDVKGLDFENNDFLDEIEKKNNENNNNEDGNLDSTGENN